MNWATFGRMLAHEGLVADAALPPRDDDSMPGYLKLLSGLGAWLAALFVLGALGTASWRLLESAPGRGVLGLAACGACAFILRRREREAGPFLAQFLTAVSLAGGVLIASVALEATAEPASLLAAAAVVAAVLLLANPEPVHRLLMALAMVGCLALAVTQWGLHPVACVLLALAAAAAWLRQARWTVAGLGPLLAPLGTACFLGLVLLPAWSPAGAMSAVLAGASIHGTAGLRGLSAQLQWLEPAGLAVVLAATIILVGRELPGRANVAARAWFAPAAAAAIAVLAAAAWQAPGILACLLGWVIGMTAGRRLLANLALFGLAWYLLWLYYDLQTSLLGKGAALLATGAVLLALYLALRLARRPRRADVREQP